MANWLAQQPHVVVRDESRRLLAAHAALDTADRFAALSAERETVHLALRRLVLEPRAGERWPGARLLVEKEPLEPIALPGGRYQDFLRHALELFPTIRVVAMVRHPVATVSSMRARRWGYSLTSGELRDVTVDEAIDTWRENAALVHALRDDPRVLACRYEHLVADPAQVTATIAAHLALPAPSAFVPIRARPLVLGDDEVARVLARTARERGWFGM